jgi:hypothetical protein
MKSLELCICLVVSREVIMIDESIVVMVAVERFVFG